MGNHIHLLAVPKSEESLSKGMGATNLVYTQYVNGKYERSGRLWQNRFFSAVIEKERYLWAAARYIEMNPVRGKLVRKAEDYPWSSARAHISGIKDETLSGKSWLDKRDLLVYREFLKTEQKETEQTIRKATSAGRPVGTGTFLKRLECLLNRGIVPRKPGRPKKIKKYGKRP